MHQMLLRTSSVTHDWPRSGISGITLIRYIQSQHIWNPNNLKVFGSKKNKGSKQLRLAMSEGGSKTTVYTSWKYTLATYQLIHSYQWITILTWMAFMPFYSTVYKQFANLVEIYRSTILIVVAVCSVIDVEFSNQMALNDYTNIHGFHTPIKQPRTSTCTK